MSGIGNTIQFAITDYAVNENAGSVTVTVTRIGDATGPAVASYATANGTATSAAKHKSRQKRRRERDALRPHLSNSTAITTAD